MFQFLLDYKTYLIHKLYCIYEWDHWKDYILAYFQHTMSTI
jgi:hypothetical protein